MGGSVFNKMSLKRGHFSKALKEVMEERPNQREQRVQGPWGRSQPDWLRRSWLEKSGHGGEQDREETGSSGGDGMDVALNLCCTLKSPGEL